MTCLAKITRLWSWFNQAFCPARNSSSLVLFKSNDQYVTLLLLSVVRDKPGKQRRKKILTLLHDQAG